MQKFVAKAAQAGMATMVGYEIGQSINQEEKQIVIKINKEDLKTAEDNEININTIILIVIIVVVLTVFISALIRAYFDSQRRRSIANDARV